jgi:hypothetical protein
MPSPCLLKRLPVPEAAILRILLPRLIFNNPFSGVREILTTMKPV